MNLKERLTGIDAMVGQGDIVNAVKKYFAESANTSDYGDLKTGTKEQMVAKMEGFTGSIAKVNGITHHHSLMDGNVSASEFTFDFDMKDGSKVYWHEVIRRVWNDDGQIVSEAYFNAQ